MKKMKVLQNGKILYKLDKEKLYERIRESQYENIAKFALAIGRSRGYITSLFMQGKDGYCKVELIEFFAKMLLLTDPMWLVEDNPKEDDPTPKMDQVSDLEEIKARLAEIRAILLTDNSLTVKLKYEPFEKVYYSDKSHILHEGIIVGYFISNKLNVTYKVEDVKTKMRFDKKEWELSSL